jgi:subtilisin-like proprotein convertase family protein
MAVRTLVLCSLLASPLLVSAGCSFGDDRRLGGGAVDAQQVDGPDIDASRIDAALAPKVFEVRPNPILMIPDNMATGVVVTFAVTGVVSTTGLEVAMHVAHTYRGDLRIDLLRNDVVIKRLKTENKDDNADDIFEAPPFPITPAELGTPLNATYSVRIADVLAIITGTVDLVRLTFKTN